MAFILTMNHHGLGRRDVATGKRAGGLTERRTGVETKKYRRQRNLSYGESHNLSSEILSAHHVH